MAGEAAEAAEEAAGEAAEKAVEKNKSELEMVEFEQKMGWRRVLAFREMKLQSAEMLEISALEERLEE